MTETTPSNMPDAIIEYKATTEMNIKDDDSPSFFMRCISDRAEAGGKILSNSFFSIVPGKKKWVFPWKTKMKFTMNLTIPYGVAMIVFSIPDYKITVESKVLTASDNQEVELTVKARGILPKLIAAYDNIAYFVTVPTVDCHVICTDDY